MLWAVPVGAVGCLVGAVGCFGWSGGLFLAVTECYGGGSDTKD